MSIHGEVHGEDPTSDRWMAYYRDARARRRARGPEMRTRVKLRKYRNRQRALVVSGFLVVGVLISICYVVLTHAT
ncbi:MAG TPA: hypothetical protein VHK47_09870 [Polyangia bacterium]|jgi:hypothetical protein|nr:hypothetical protein [Polyangia bacterium]